MDGFDVTVSLAGNTAAYYEGLSTVDDLLAQDCEYVTFTGSGALAAMLDLGAGSGPMDHMFELKGEFVGE